MAQKLRDRNKTVLFDALAAAGISHVIVSFDGYGDSGQIESLEAKAGDDTVDLPEAQVTVAIAEWGQADAEPRSQGPKLRQEISEDIAPARDAN